MAKWIEKPGLSAGQLADGDKMLLGDVSEAVGSRDKTVTLGDLRAFLGAGVTVAVTQASHGLAVGDVIRHNGTSYVAATADTASNAEAVGVVTSVPDANSFAYQTAGHVSGLSGLTAGELYFLQDDGSLGTASGTVEKPVLVAVSTTAAVLVLATGSGGGGGGGAESFTDLDDTPASYSGHGGKYVAVNSGATALEFTQAPPLAVNAQTGTSYTLVLTDAGKLVTLSNGSAITLTIPTNASVAFPVGTVIAGAQLGAGAVTIQGATGVTVNGASAGSEATAAQYATFAMTKLATDTWLVSGALAE